MTPGAAPPQPLPRIDALVDAAVRDGQRLRAFLQYLESR
jgi:hypothetical protein